MSVRPTQTELIDLFWRSVWTFIGAALGGTAVIALAHWDISSLQVLAISGGGAVVTVIKAYASNKLLGTGTATSRETPVGGFMQPVASLQAVPAGSAQPPQSTPAA